MLTLSQILKISRMRAQCGDPGVPVPRDHYSPEYYIQRGYEETNLREQKGREQEPITEGR